MRDIFVDYLYNRIQNDKNVILLTADLGFGIFDRFNIYRDKQYFNVGVCEQLMASMAAGMSSEGFKLYIYSLGVFPSMRCLEQIRNDISYHECNVTIVTTGAGFSYGSLGMTHHCVQDIGVMSSIPNIRIFTPANNFEHNRNHLGIGLTSIVFMLPISLSYTIERELCIPLKSCIIAIKPGAMYTS